MNQLNAVSRAVRQACTPDRSSRLVAGVLFASVLGTNSAMAGPEAGQVVSGVGSITQTDTSTLITQGSERLGIDWQSFNVATNESVRFDQPSSSAVALNRIFDQNPSQILGALDANGRVYLINPNGIVFGQNAQINVGALLASSLDISLEDFAAGNDQFSSNGNAGLVVNRGLIRAATGGSVTLLGGTVANEGLIVAELGHVTLAAGTHASLDFDGDGLLFFAVDGDVLTNNTQADAAVSNSGTIQANGGEVLLSGRAAQNVFSNVVNNQGVIRAARIENEGGVVRLVGGGGPVITSGDIDVSGADAASTGGRIEVLGEKVGVAGGASLVADGAAGGGTILVGGDAHGGGGIPTADYAFVGVDAEVSADALGTGDGGKVVVWAEEVARVYGDFSARGGAGGGDGGFIETSGRKYLDFQGTADASAPNGSGGTWLLDPEDVIITNATNNISTDPGPPITFAPTAEDDADTTIDVALINTALGNGSNVTVTTTPVDPTDVGNVEAGNITVDAPILKAADTGGDGSTLTLLAEGSIIVDDPATVGAANLGSITSTVGALNVVLTANGSITVNAPINANTGTITFNLDADDNGAETLTLASTLVSGSALNPAIEFIGSNAVADDLLVVSRGVGETAIFTVDGVGGANRGTLLTTGSTVGRFRNFISLLGGAQNDIFNIDTAFAGNIAGDLGTNTLDFTNLAGARNVMLTAGGANGFAGTVAAVGGGFADIDSIIAGAAATDRITGFNAIATWGLDGTNTYTVGANELGFAGFEQLRGGINDDTFAVTATFTGDIDANIGTNVLTFAGSATARAITLTAADADGFAGSVAAVTLGFVNIDSIVGGSGTDSLTGLDAAATWGIDGTNSYTSGGFTLPFSAIENLVGGTGNFIDTFDLDVALNGSVDGNGGADVLDLADFATPIAVTLTAGAAEGFSGTVTGVTDFVEINDIIGTTAGADTLTGANATATWAVNLDQYSTGGFTLDYSSFETLAGGSGADNFDVNATFTGAIDGNAGTDTLDLAGVGTARAVVLTAGTVDGFAGTEAAVTGNFADIDNFIGDAVATTDSLTGLDATSTWGLAATTSYASGLASATFSNFDSLVGGTGADTFAVTATFTGTVDGNGGTDILSFAGSATARTIALTAADADGFDGTVAAITGGFFDINNIVGGSGTDSLAGLDATSTWGLDGTETYSDGTFTLAFSAVENLLGGTGVDTFAVTAAHTGSVDGNTGADVLTFAGSATTRAITLTAADADGFDGSVAALTTGFLDINEIVGGDGATDSLTGLNAISTWALDGTNTYSDGTNLLAFSALENLLGGNLADTFDIDAAHTGLVDGNVGTDVLDLGGFATTRNVVLVASGGNGFNGTEAAVSTGFQDINTLIGGTGTDTLTGLTATATWGIDGTNTYTNDTNGDPPLAFSAIENLTGGSDPDTFDFSVAFGGNVNGAGEADVFNLAAGANLGGTILGGAGNDSFNFNGGNATATINGEGGDDTFTLNSTAVTIAATIDAGTNGVGIGDRVVGSALGDTFVVSAPNTVAVNVGGPALLTVNNVESAFGVGGTDTFDLNSTLSGQVDGGAQADILDLVGVGGTHSVVLASGGANGFAGTVGAVGGGFVDIDNLIGGAGADTLTGLNGTATWGVNTNLYASGGNTLTFSSFEILVGGTGADTFDIDANYTGTLDGNAGTDILDLADVTGARDVALTSVAADGFTGTEASVSGGFVDIDNIIGGAGTDRLAGLNAVATWGLDGTNTYAVAGGTLAFSSFETLAGGGLVDTFDVDTAFTGSVDGNVGADVLDLGGFATARSVVLTASGVDGFDGTEAAVSTGFADIDNIVGGSATDTLTGFNATSTWDIDGTNTYASGGFTLAFSSLENLAGGAGADTFDVDVALTGTLDGNAGADVLNLGGFGTALAATLTAADADGFDGTVTGVASFADVDTLIGGAATDTLTGLDATATWSVDGTDTYASGGFTLPFSSFENLAGGSGADTFDVDAVFAGSVDGNAGADVLDLSTFGTARDVVLTAGAANGFAGTEAALGTGFSDIDDLRAPSGGPDLLTGLNAAAVWQIDGTDTYASGGNTLAFSEFESLTGGTGADTFEIDALTAANDLSGGTGADIVDLGGLVAAQTVQVAGILVDGFAGTGTGFAFDGIDDIRGTAATDTLEHTGGGAATWGIDGSNTFSVGPGQTLAFASFENLVGGAGADTFDVDVANSGSIDGNAGADVLDLGTFATARDVLLTNAVTDGFAGTEAAVGGGFADIDDIRGGTAADTLRGINVGAAWNLDGTNEYQTGFSTLAFAGFENLVGGNGVGPAFNDTFFVNAPHTGSINGNGGNATIAFGVAGPRTVTLTSGAATGFAGTEASLSGGFADISAVIGGAAPDTLTGLNAASTWSISGSGTSYTSGGNTLLFSSFDVLAGGSGADTFDVDVVFAGSVRGNAGADVLDLAGLPAARSVTLTAGSAAGFSGTEADVTGGFFDIDNLIGGSGTDSLTGLGAVAVWGLDGTNSYLSGGNTLAFSSFETLAGGALADTFDVDAAFTGSIDGNAGADVLDLGGFATARNVTLTAGTATGFAGTEAGVSGGFADIDNVIGGSAATDSLTGLNAAAVWGLDGTNTYVSGGNTLAFSAFENLAGGTLADTFDVDAAFTGTVDGNGGADVLDLAGVAGARSVTLTAGTATGFAGTEAAVSGGFADIDDIRGGSAADTLTGLNAASTWGVTGTASSYVTSGFTLAFASFENLVGGTGVDTFDLDVALNGSVDGNGGADVLDLGGFATARSVTLTAGGTEGFAGTEASVGTFADINDIRGGTAADALTGLDAAATWGLDGTNTYVSGGNTLAFASFETLAGGTGIDTFDVDAVFAGSVDGNAGADVLDLTGFATARAVLLTASATTGFSGTEASVTGGFADIDDLSAGAATADALTGTNAVATWGLDGTNTYTVGTAVLAFAGFEVFTGGNLADTFNVDASSAAAMNGGAGDDNFVFAGGVTAGGIVDGGAGADILNLSRFTTARNVTITAADGEGFDGTEASVTQGFRNFDNILGSATAGTADRLNGLAGAAGTWTLAGDSGSQYVVNSQTLQFANFGIVAGSTLADVFRLAAGTQTGNLEVIGGGGADSADVTGALNLGASTLTLTNLQTITDTSGATLTAGTLSISGASGGVGTTAQPLMTNIGTLNVTTSGTRLVVREANDLSIGPIDLGGPSLASGSSTIAVASGSITSTGSEANPLLVSGASATFIATGDIGAPNNPIVFNLSEDGLLQLLSPGRTAYVTNLNQTDQQSTAAVDDTLRRLLGALLGTSTQSAVQDTAAIDWAGLDPNVALVDCLQPCVRLPGDQSEDEGLAQLRDATKLLLIRTRDGWKMIPVFPVETTAALR